MDAALTPETGTYLYGMVKSAPRPTTRGIPAGLPGASRPRMVEAGDDLWLIVADVPWDAYSAEAINRNLPDLNWVSRCAVAHEAVVEAFLRRGSVLPAKLFTIFTSDESVLQHAARQRQRFRKLLDRIAGHLEWGVRVSVPPGGAKLQVRARRTKTPVSGSDYLSAKRAAYADAVELSRRADSTIKGVHRRLEGLAAESRRRAPVADPSGHRLLLDAAYLVPNRGGARFRSAAAKLARELAGSGYALVLSGPWPAYNFVSGGRREGS